MDSKNSKEPISKSIRKSTPPPPPPPKPRQQQDRLQVKSLKSGIVSKTSSKTMDSNQSETIDLNVKTNEIIIELPKEAKSPLVIGQIVIREKSQTPPSVIEKSDSTTPPPSIIEKSDGTTPPPSIIEKSDGTTSPTSIIEKSDGTTPPSSIMEKSDSTTPPPSIMEKSDSTTPPPSIMEKSDSTTPPPSIIEKSDSTTPPSVSGKSQIVSIMIDSEKTDGKTMTQEEELAAMSADPEDKLEVVSSELSLGFGDLVAELEDQPSALVIKDGPDLYQTILRTISAYAFRCPHGKIAVQKLAKHDGYWLPFGCVSETEKYSKVISSVYEFFVQELKSEDSLGEQSVHSSTTSNQQELNEQQQQQFLKNTQLYNIYRFQIPDGQFISRYIFLAEWVGSDRVVCCKNSVNLKWLPLEDFATQSKNPMELYDFLWGNEIISVASTLYQQHVGKMTTFRYPNILEFTSAEVMKYANRNNRSHSKTTANQQMLSLLSDAKFMEKDVIKIYCDFVQHCFPAMNMTYVAFSEYVRNTELLLDDENISKNVFRSISHKSKIYMLYNEFLIGLACLDPGTPDSPLRLSYVFRYYDQDSDNFLSEQDFKQIIVDIRERNGLPCTDKDVEADVASRMATSKLFDGKKRISFDTFIREAASGRLKGVDGLFRAKKPVMETLHSRHLYEFINNKTGKPFAPRLVGTCPKCKPKSYSLAFHAVRLNTLGRIDESKPLIYFNCGEIDAELQFKKKSHELTMAHSIEVVFNENSTANKVLSIIRNMVDFNKLTRERKNEIQQFVVANLTVDLIASLCREVTEIFLIEPPVMKINTPCIVMGDLHGNINDLLTYERQLWSLAPTSNAPNVLFLGDYVDRGDYSIEVISYLFAMKLLAPTKFFLLRGNHEIRSIQRNFTFARECMLKYFYQNGQRVFEEFNSVFDLMPLVGIIDESIFCAHGGIPFSVSKIEDLYKIPMPLPDPENQSKAAWEILWSDPVTDEEYTQVCQFKNQVNDTGYTGNLRRSTAYYFTEKALKAFLKNNNLSHVIRAHELEAEGYRFHHSGLLITVFSSSRYCNTNNKSAAVFVSSRENEGFIKIIALET